VLVLDDHLAIDQGGFAGQLAASIDHPRGRAATLVRARRCF
jgi:hypothetical protein